jgi:hypothetical protein
VISESFGEDGDDLVVCSPPFGRRRRYVSWFLSSLCCVWSLKFLFDYFLFQTLIDGD